MSTDIKDKKSILQWLSGQKVNYSHYRNVNIYNPEKTRTIHNAGINNEPEYLKTIDLKERQGLQFYKTSGIVLIVILLLGNLFTSCTNVDKPFYNKVLNDFDSTSYFISLNIKSPSYKGRAIIENKDLYSFLHKTRGYDKNRYLSFMKRTLAHYRALKINDEDIDAWNFKKVYLVESVLRNANNGKNNFVTYYFTGTVLKYGIPERERNAIIDQLFYWEYPAKIDKVTGNLIIG